MGEDKFFSRDVMCKSTSDGNLSIVTMMGPVSPFVRMLGREEVESFFNPCKAFRQVHIVSLGDELDDANRCFSTVRVHPIRRLFRTGLLKLADDISLSLRGSFRLLKITRHHQVSLLVQTYGGPLRFGLPIVLVARLLGLPSVITLQNDYDHMMRVSYDLIRRMLARLLWPVVLHLSYRIRSVSSYIAQFALRHYNVPAAKVQVLQNKADLTRFANCPDDKVLEAAAEQIGLAELSPESIFVLTVSRLVKQKNLPASLEAFQEAVRVCPQLVLLIAGDGPLERELRDLCIELGIGSNVRFLGFLPHEHLSALYHLSHIFLFATLYEGQPRVVIEALIAGLPIICANYGQVCEVVKDGQDGIWVDPADSASVAEAIVRLARSPELRSSMSHHTEFDASAYDIEKVGRQEVDFYRSAIQAFNEAA
jgi:glycosyltransferase involved in cell wall biosynthesis